MTTNEQNNDRGVTVVTGAASGMGLAAARRLLDPQVTMVLVDIDRGRLDAARTQLLEQCPTATIDVACVDVCDADSVNGLVTRVAGHGRLSILSHAAGISPTMADWERVIQVNLVGTAIVLDSFLPALHEGSVGVCWSSGAAYMGSVAVGDPAIDLALDAPLAPDLIERLATANEAFTGPYGSSAAYGWSKRGVIRLMQRLTPAWGARGARLLTVAPGIIDTPMARFEYQERSYMHDLIVSSPVARMGTAEEVAELVAYLTSPAASFITGADFLIDGGCAAMLAQRR